MELTRDCNLSTSLGLGLIINQLLDRHWKTKFTATPNNPYPLAPGQLVKMDLVNNFVYTRQELSLRWFCTWAMLREAYKIESEIEPGEYGNILEVWGSGLGRDLGLLRYFLDLKFRAVIRDNCTLACQKASAFAQDQGIGERVEVKQCDIIQSLHDLDLAGTAVIYLAQCFLQILTEEDERLIMKTLGQFLASARTRRAPKRRVYILTARRQDNNKPVKWRGKLFKTVEFGESALYNHDQILQPAQEGFGSAEGLDLRVVAKHNYYHQKYVLLRMMAA